MKPENMETPVKPETKVKNPAKVAAGRRSAEIRKTREAERKQRQVSLEERLAHLEEHKLRILDDAVPVVPSGGTPDEVPVQTVTAPGTSTRNVKFDLTPWVIGVGGLAAVVYGLYRQAPVAKPVAKQQPTPTVQVPVATQQPQLNRRDPFHME